MRSDAECFALYEYIGTTGEFVKELNVLWGQKEFVKALYTFFFLYWECKIIAGYWIWP